ncbi:MAG TPA: HigA family addiction module antitoxin [Propionibacteriaceae bacterium]
MASAHAPIHPAEVLLEEFLIPLGISQYRLAQAISVPPRRINEIVHGKRAISPDTALRLTRAVGTSDRFWKNLQTPYDLDTHLEAHRGSSTRSRPWSPDSAYDHLAYRVRRNAAHVNGWVLPAGVGWCSCLRPRASIAGR